MRIRVWGLVVGLLVLGVAGPVAATLTQSQCGVLSTDILITNAVEFADLIAGGSVSGLRQAYALPAVPPYWVIRTSITRSLIQTEQSPDATLWNWTAYINRSQGERDAWRELFSGEGQTMNPSLPNVQPAIDNIFSGTGIAAQQRTHIGASLRRTALRSERLFAVPPGDGNAGSPAKLVIEGGFSDQDVTLALQQRCAELP